MICFESAKIDFSSEHAALFFFFHPFYRINIFARRAEAQDSDVGVLTVSDNSAFQRGVGWGGTGGGGVQAIDRRCRGPSTPPSPPPRAHAFETSSGNDAKTCSAISAICKIGDTLCLRLFPPEESWNLREKENNVLLIVSCLSQTLSSVIL